MRRTVSILMIFIVHPMPLIRANGALLNRGSRPGRGRPIRKPSRPTARAPDLSGLIRSRQYPPLGKSAVGTLDCLRLQALRRAPTFTPAERSNRHLSMYDPGTGKFTLISTCFQTHHLVFAEDANNTLWTSAGGPASGVVGWLNRKVFEETGDEQKAQGWNALILDTNGNGKRDGYVEPEQPVDPAKDKRVTAALYSVAVNPVDGTVWGTSLGFPGYAVRLNPGADPPETALAEVYEPPFPGYGPRGGDIDREGVFGLHCPAAISRAQAQVQRAAQWSCSDRKALP